ncbi:hypothetical protein [Paraburkholderia sp. J63]|uniref:hypothetical protein n=1 Tax=Paraburkholderia sp. J63 TaxID=2805434 RepID=UPI002ABD63BC|nr:hypothetical protein [Paraburkholderia sp. J63]
MVVNLGLLPALAQKALPASLKQSRGKPGKYRFALSGSFPESSNPGKERRPCLIERCER